MMEGREDWYGPLNERLAKRFCEEFVPASTWAGIAMIAISEVLSGTSYVIGRRRRISATLDESFGFENDKQCLLTRITRARDYRDAILLLGLDSDKASDLGFSRSNGMFAEINEQKMRRNIKEEIHQVSIRVSNFLWREVGLFFREHPEYGTK